MSPPATSTSRKATSGPLPGDTEEATLWNPGEADAFLKLGESDEKVHDFPAAREAYSKYLELMPDAKNASELKKKIVKWPSK